MQERSQKLFSRRDFLFLAASLPLLSCQKLESVLNDIEYADALRYYPELKNYQLIEKGSFTTKNNKKTNWFNLSQANFNPQIAKRIYEIFEQLADTQLQVSSLTRGQKDAFVAKPRQKTERILFLVPEGAPAPTWSGEAPPGSAAHLAATTGLLTQEPYTITFVRIFESAKNLPPSSVFTNIESNTNLAFNVEVCQSAIHMQPVDPTRSPNVLVQEFTCNSLGAAFTLKQMGINYGEYQAWARRVTSMPVMLLSEEQYNGIQLVGLAIKPTRVK